MPINKEWNISDITIYKGSWNLEGEIRKARISISSTFTIDIDDKTKIPATAQLSTRLEFVDIDNADEILGYIDVSSLVKITMTLDLSNAEISPEASPYREIAEDISKALFGNNRAEIRRIATAAGLRAPVVLPLQTIEGEKWNLRVNSSSEASESEQLDTSEITPKKVKRKTSKPE